MLTSLATKYTFFLFGEVIQPVWLLLEHRHVIVFAAGFYKD